jgi:sulfite exporter TauE/SafE
MNGIDLFMVLWIAFLGSVGHCIGMCGGGIVVAYTSAKIKPYHSKYRTTLSHLVYSLGRVTTYTILGAMFGLLMLLAGVSLLGNSKFLNSAEFSISNNKWFQDIFRKLISNDLLSSFYLLGMLNGIIPCGLVYLFTIFAANTASMLWGALVMAIFGLATIPAMFFLATVTRFLQQGSFRNTMMKLAALMVVAYGVITLYKGYKFIRYPQ